MNLKIKYPYLLVVSLSLIALGFSLSYFLDKEQDLFSNPIYLFFRDFPLGFIFFFTVIFAPITEELAFRSWACKKKYWTWVSLIVSSLFVGVINIYAGIIYALVYLSIIIFTRNNPKHRLISLLILTSLAFASLHYGNLQIKSYLLAFPQYLGVGLLFAYLTLRFNLLTAIITHILNNFVVLLLTGIILSPNENFNLENSHYKADITGVSPNWGFGGGMPSMYGWDTITIENENVGSIAKSLIELSDSTFCVIDNQVDDFRRYNILAVKKDTSEKLDYKQLLIDISKTLNIKIDTFKQNRKVWVLNARDWDNLEFKRGSKFDYQTHYIKGIYSLCRELSYPSLLSTEETLDVIPQKGVINRTILMKNDYYSLSKFSEKKEMLDSNYGITLTQKDTVVNVIRLRNK